MKLDKETLVFIVVCVGILIVGKPIARSFGLLPPDKQPDQAIALWAAENPPSESFRFLKNDQMVLAIDPEKGNIDRIVLSEYFDYTQKQPIDLYPGMTGGALSVSDPGAPWTFVKVESESQDGATYTLTRRMKTPTGSEFLLTQAWTLQDEYRVANRVTLQNVSGAPLVFPHLVVNGGDLAPWAMYSGDLVRMPSHRMDVQTTGGKNLDIKAGTEEKENSKFFQNPLPQVTWAGSGNKFFCTLMTSDQPFILSQNRYYYKGLKEGNVVIGAGALYPNFLLGADASHTFEFRAYYGPKIISQLKEFAPGAERVMHLAWGPLDYLARLLLWTLVALHSLTGSYGVSIILLTLIVRGLFYPITAKANASMRKMQAIQPRMKEIREKYKSNPQVQMAKMQELQRTEGVNPLGGCLPILLQIPVFFALYATLDGAVELRQVSFLWARDLASADTVLTIPLYFFDLPINPLALIMTGLLVIQQQMTPMSLDPMHKKMMLAMPIVMLLFLYDLPSGLTLYWSVSNLFSIIQMRLQRRHYKDQGTTPAAVAGK